MSASKKPLSEAQANSAARCLVTAYQLVENAKIALQQLEMFQKQTHFGLGNQQPGSTWAERAEKALTALDALSIEAQLLVKEEFHRE